MIVIFFMKSAAIKVLIGSLALCASLLAAPVCTLKDDACKECDEAIDAMRPEEHRTERIKKVVELATLGHQYAQAQLTAFYALGIGAEVDESKVAAWTLKLAESGVEFSQYEIGVMYSTGRGVEKDEAQGVKWIKRSAMQGYAPAQRAMGDACLDGIGVPKNPQQAVVWFHKSAAQSDIPAFVSLADCYAKGLGVNQDLVIAYQYFDVAASAGSEAAKLQRDDLAEKMTEAQISKGRAMSAELQVELGFDE